MSALLGGMSWRCDNGNGSSAAHPHGLAIDDLDTNEMVEVGAFQLICPTIKYQPRKANEVADALIKSQRKRKEDSTDDLATIVIHEPDKWLMICYHCHTSKTSLQVVPPAI